ncbi:amidohydrolase family-domain-containing protein [Boletus edulis BED1]|uniref:Amidohydrolase family-domain-containing protein n=1 Tax=Boletus edulis BED1 TaxID=1328754 RepID=A0AAD4BW71_BOLED|nr:amidohydrolase family-domain-containing protein [Boletus edulis BED1]
MSQKLRRRNIADSIPAPNETRSQTSIDATQSSLSTSSIALSVLIVSSLVTSALFWLYTQVPPASVDAYAVCSRFGQRVYTVDDDNSAVQCLVIRDEFIVDTGSLDDVSARWYAVNPSGLTLQIRYINDESIVVPGLSDSHAHILEYGANQQLPLEGGKSINETVALVRDYIVEHPDVYLDRSMFIEGWGWDHTSWPIEEWPSADALDEDPVIRGRPVVLQSKDCHALWVSKMVLQQSGPFPIDVEGGVVVRDELGNLTGVLLDNAQQLVKKPISTEADLRRRFAITAKDALSLGLTSIHDAGLQPISLQFFERQAAEGLLPIRIYGMRYFDEAGPYFGNISKPIVNAGNGRLNVRSVKIFADGALRSGGAALYEPYHDNPRTKGFMRLDEEVLREIVPRFLKDKWQVNVHAIGDYANSVVLDTFEAALKDVNVTALRPRLEHAQILREEDMIRVGRLGVIASVQPTHATSDMWYAEARLGPERVKGLYAFRSLLDHGARLALGSDFPVEDMNPLSGFYAAVTRLSPDGVSPGGPSGWFPEQCLSRVQALRGLTIDAAYASFTEDTLGSITPGKRADFVVLSQDIMSISVDQILKSRVQATFIDGELVYGSL